MKDTDVTKRYLLPDEVDINPDMLGAAVLNWIRSHVDRTNIVTEDDGRSIKVMMKHLK
jgi:hypothetical protein